MEGKKENRFQVFHKIEIPERHKKVLMIALLVLGFGVILAGYRSTPISENAKVDFNEQINNSFPVSSESTIIQAEAALEKRLEDILSQISGAGKTAVSVTLNASPEYEYAINVSTSEKSITENDQTGGNRVTLDNTETGQLVLIRNTGNSGENPVVVKEMKPEVLGVLVVAQGAGNTIVKVELTRAVQTLLGLSADQINVVSGGGR